MTEVNPTTTLEPLRMRGAEDPVISYFVRDARFAVARACDAVALEFPDAVPVVDAATLSRVRELVELAAALERRLAAGAAGCPHIGGAVDPD